MIDHPAVRRIKGQPGRWTRSVQREQHYSALRELGDLQATPRAELDIFKAFRQVGAQIAEVVEQARMGAPRVGAQLAALMDGIRVDVLNPGSPMDEADRG